MNRTQKSNETGGDKFEAYLKRYEMFASNAVYCNSLLECKNF